MRKFWIVISVCWLWTCGGGDSPTEPKAQLPTVQNFNLEVIEDTPKSFVFMGTDPLSGVLSYGVSTQPQHGTLTINAGNGTYAPNANYHGTDTFAYIAINADGNSNVGTVQITITPVDDEPNSMDVDVTTDEDNAIDITLEAEEVDGDNIEFRVRNYPSNGSVTISGTTATYTPNENWNGTDTFNFEAVDNNAKSVLNVATATITVNPVNDAPQIEDINIGTVLKNSSIDITLVGTDVEGDNITFSIVDSPENGTISLNDNIVSYTPSSILGSESFTYKASDGMIESELATVSIVVDSHSIFGSYGDDLIVDIIETSDGGFVGVGSSTSSSGRRCFIMKIDSEGNQLWNNVYSDGSSRNNMFFSVTEASDGSLYSSGRNEYQSIIIHYSSEGSVIGSYQRTNSNGVVKDITQTSDNRIIYADYAGAGGVSTIKKSNYDLDSVGSIQLGSTNFPGYNTEGELLQNIADMGAIIPLSDEKYIVGGMLKPGSGRHDEFAAAKIDMDSGEIITAKIFDDTTDIGRQFFEMIQSSNGGYIFVGTDGDGYLLKASDDLDLEWISKFDCSQVFPNSNDCYGISLYSIANSTDGGYVVAVGDELNFSTYDLQARLNGFTIIKIDEGGTSIIAKKTFSYNESTGIALSIKQTSDGGFIIAGVDESSENNGGVDVLIVKVDSDLNKIF